MKPLFFNECVDLQEQQKNWVKRYSLLRPREALKLQQQQMFCQN